MAAAGFAGLRRIAIARGEVFERSADDVVASVFSLVRRSALFGDRLGAFEAELRALLRRASPDDRFAERAREIELVLWKP